MQIDRRPIGSNTGKIMEEVVEHRTSLARAGITITLEIQTTLPDTASSDVVRTVTENCCSLRFESYGFEEK